MLDEEKTAELLIRAKSGDNAAKEELITNNASLIKSIVRRYIGKGVEYDDLFQLASIGFLKAVAGFDFSYEVKFSTYAVPMIAGEIKRFMRDDGSLKVSRVLKKNARDINKFILSFTLENGAPPSVKEIAAKFYMEESEVAFTMGASKMPVSIYEKGDYKDDETAEMVERIPSPDGQDEMIDSIILKDAIGSLGERERKIIFLRYFKDMTQSEVAKLIGVSQVQVSRIETKVIEKFKEELA